MLRLGSAGGTGFRSPVDPRAGGDRDDSVQKGKPSWTGYTGLRSVLKSGDRQAIEWGRVSELPWQASRRMVGAGRRCRHPAGQGVSLPYLGYEQVIKGHQTASTPHSKPSIRQADNSVGINHVLHIFQETGSRWDVEESPLAMCRYVVQCGANRRTVSSDSFIMAQG